MATRQIRSIEDAAQAIKELQDQLIEPLTRPHWDFHQRRIRNAKPSQLPYDYVVRKELRQGAFVEIDEAFGEGEGGEVASVFYIKSFGYAINGNAEVGSDVAPRMVLPFNCSLLKSYAILKVAATGANFVFDINLIGTGTILTAPIAITAGSTSVFTATAFAIDTFSDEDILSLDIDQVGSTIPGSGLVVTLKFQIS